MAHGSVEGEQRGSNTILRKRGVRGYARVQVFVSLRSGRLARSLLGLHENGVGVAPSQIDDAAGKAAAEQEWEDDDKKVYGQTRLVACAIDAPLAFERRV